jgi:hypothetical protein
MHGNNETPAAAEAGRDADQNRVEPTAQKSLDPLLKEIKQKHGDSLLAILVYGSWLRGKRDTMLDFYVLVENYHTLVSAWQGWMCRLLPPNVYQIHVNPGQTGDAQHGLRAKYAVLTLSRFHHAMKHDFHSYFWARFAQPCEILFVRDHQCRLLLEKTFERAANTFIRHVLPIMPGNFSSADLWTTGLAQTYQCELRTESVDLGDSIYEFNPDHYDQLLSEFSQQSAGLLTAGPAGTFNNHTSPLARKFSGIQWWLRRALGKILSVKRLFKAAFTFNEPLEYLLWKIERHSGHYIEPSPLQLKHPLIFSWPLLWKLYRLGAFR